MKANYSKILIAASFVAMLISTTASAEYSKLETTSVVDEPKTESAEYIAPNVSDVKHRNLGLGILAGEPSGISAKFWIAPSRAIDGAIAWSTGTHNDINLYFDYLMHNFTALESKMTIYYGFGARLKYETVNDDKDSRIGIRLPLGLSYLFPTAPCDVFLEVVPILDLIPNSDFDINVGIGVRYYFF
jgi:hypothetical protein